MNHERVHLLLDTKSAAELTAAERLAVDQHLASCSECREIWEAYDELAGLRIPATPPYLRVRIATALAARATARSRARWGLLIGAVLLAGAAVAFSVLRLTNGSPDPAPEPVPTFEEAAPAVEPAVPPEPPAPSDEPVPSSPEPAEPSAASDTLTYPLDPFSVLVVSLNDPAADEETAAALGVCHDAVVEQLRRVVGLNVIAGERLKPFSGSNSPEIQIARELAAGSVLILRSMMRQPSCSVLRFNVETGGSPEAVISMTGTLPGGSMPNLPENVAGEAREALLEDAATLEAEARATILNTALRDNQRAGALFRLRIGSPPPGFDTATLAAALQIGTSSRDMYARAAAWRALQGVTDLSIVQPLLHSLANDAADEVRSAAALTLGSFVDRPEVRDALTQAAAEVPAEAPKVSIYGEFTVRTVRLAARLALRAGDEPNEAVRKTVLDESLTPQERLVLVPPASPSPRRLDELGDEAVRAVFALGSSSDDHDVRSRAWSLLGYVRETDFVPTLLEDLTRHPAESIRAAAATGLTQHRDDPDIRAALDRALADPSPRVQRAARNALDGARIAF